jgi:hypothetical protein
MSVNPHFWFEHGKRYPRRGRKLPALTVESERLLLAESQHILRSRKARAVQF